MKNFFKELPIYKEQWSFIKKQTTETNQNIFIKSMKDESGNVTESQTEIASI